MAKGEEHGALGWFWADFYWAARVSAKSTVLVLAAAISAGVAGLWAHAGHRVLPAWALLAIPLAFFEVGFIGTERVFFFRRARNENLSGEDIWSLTLSFFWRFVRMGLIWLVLEALVSAVMNPLVGHNALIWSTVTAGLVGDLVLTFAVPALVFATDSAREAMRLGLAATARHWRVAWPYLLAPGLTVGAVGQVWNTRDRAVLPGVVIALVGSVLGLWFKGAIVRLYLRLYPQAEPVIGERRDRVHAVRRSARDASWSGPPRQIIPERMPDEPSVADIARRWEQRPQNGGGGNPEQ